MFLDNEVFLDTKIDENNLMLNLLRQKISEGARISYATEIGCIDGNQKILKIEKEGCKTLGCIVSKDIAQQIIEI